MPRYTYRCDVCGNSFDVSHSISEKLTDCECGEEGSLSRIPSLPFHASVKTNKQKAGQIIKEFIKDAKKEVKQTKQEMSKEVNDV